MNIMIGINDKYTFPAKVMLTSLCENNKAEKHNVFVLYDENNLNDKNIISLKELEKQYKVRIIPLKFDANCFKEFPISHHFSVETYFRFMAQDMLPNDIDRVLWLDADMIINQSIESFYYQDFNNKMIAVCKTANPNAGAYLERLGLNKDEAYFNAGIILFNLNLIRQKITTKIFFDCLNEYKDKIYWLDQDILNIVFLNEKKVINNQIFNYTFMVEKNFSNSEKKYIKNNICILHYIGGIKPWHINYTNCMIKYFRKYARKQEKMSEAFLFDLKNFYIRYISKYIRKIINLVRFSR